MTFFSNISTNGAIALDLSEVEVIGAPVSPSELALMVQEVADYQDEQSIVDQVHRTDEERLLHRLGMCDGRCEKALRYVSDTPAPQHDRAQMLCDCPLTDEELAAAEEQTVEYEREQQLLHAAHPSKLQRQLHAHGECDGKCARFSIFR